MTRVSSFGLFFGALALLLAIIPSYLMPVLYPAPAVTQQALDTVERLKDRALAKLKGENYRAAPSHRSERANWHRYTALATAVSAVFAILLGALGYVRHEASRACTVAMVLGVVGLLLESLFGLAATWIFID